MLDMMSKKSKNNKGKNQLNYHVDFEAFKKAIDSINEAAGVKSTTSSVDDALKLMV